MKEKLITGFFISILQVQLIAGQTETYTVSLASFSSGKYDEFSPVFYKNGIVFCSNYSDNLFFNYSDPGNSGHLKINYIETANNNSWHNARLFSKNLSTKLNDGLVTFNNTGDTIYYSRNLEDNGKLNVISSPKNTLGIFTAVLVDGKWTKIKELRFNSERYNITSPSLSPDGKTLFLVSDKPGGYGGSDIYFCQWKGNYWSSPVNLGPVINTPGNESYPYVTPAGDLLFSSDGHPGLGKKDIFFSRFSDTAWIKPIHLDPPINSQYDDFGIVTDTLMNTGYFSSNRNKSIDIFNFKTNLPQLFYSSIQKENENCFMFSDSGSIVVDTTNLQYKWYFGDGKSERGATVKHCFPGSGNYIVRLDIIDKVTGKLFFTKLIYNLLLRDDPQSYINSSDVAATGDVIEFDALKSSVPGFGILNYSWDFGDGSRSSGGSVGHSYKNTGEYVVNLGLILKSVSTGNIRRTGVSKKIFVSEDPKERASWMADKASLVRAIPDIRNYKNAELQTLYSAESEFQEDAVFMLELFSSESKVDLNSSYFSKIPGKYIIKVVKKPGDSIYRYIVDQQLTLMATYPSYRELFALGFKDVKTSLLVLTDPPEKDLNNIIRTYGDFAESYFDRLGRLTSGAYIVLDQIVKLMEKYPSINMEVSVYTDNIGSEENNQTLSQRQSEMLINYMTGKGINSKRLIAKGNGESRPIASNFLEKNRKLNRRITYVISN